MCWGCVAEAFQEEGAPWDWSDGALPPVPVQYAPICRAIRAFYQTRDGIDGGPLHVVLDDTNVEDSSIKWSLDQLDAEEGTREWTDQTVVTCRAIGAALLGIRSLALRALIVQVSAYSDPQRPPGPGVIAALA